MIGYIIIVLFAVIMAAILINAWRIERYYNEVTKYLQLPKIKKPSLFSCGVVSGLYKGRRAEFRCLKERGEGEDWLFAIQAKMDIQDKSPYKSSGIPFADKISLSDGWLVYSSSGYIFKKENILAILDKLYLAAKKYEENLVVKCFECGEEIEKDQNKCPKCGWTWQK